MEVLTKGWCNSLEFVLHRCQLDLVRLRLNLEFVEAGLCATPTDERWGGWARQIAGVGDLALNKDSELILKNITLVSRLRPLV
jgi:hypothetical protein